MTSARAIFVFGVAVVSVTSGHWVNDYDRDALMECRGNEAMSFIGSIHSNYYEDRRWQYQCRQTPGSAGDCYWTGYLNDFDHQLLFSCPQNEIIFGMNSYHSDKYEDRRFQVKCCKVFWKSTKNCYFTDFINDWDGVMHFNVPENQFIKGFYSYHDNKKEDRIWKVNLCNLI